MPRAFVVFVLAVLLTTPTVLTALNGNRLSQDMATQPPTPASQAPNGKGLGSTEAASYQQKSHAYHADAPKGPLPKTLDPERFRDKKAAFVTYSMAAKIRELLYQVPCYCSCDRDKGHESLLDCYVGDHGVGCPTCQKEVIYCYRQFQAGKTASQIRDGIAKGEPWKIDPNQ